MPKVSAIEPCDPTRQVKLNNELHKSIGQIRVHTWRARTLTDHLSTLDGALAISDSDIQSLRTSAEVLIEFIKDLGNEQS